MPRDDLSIDFVRKMPPVEILDPALILDEWINRTQNLPEEIRFLQDEVAEKDRQYDKLVREIDDRDARIQKWIKAHGSHQHNPKEEEYRALIRKNFAQADQLANEKIALTQKLQLTMDKHIRHLDMQIKMLYDRAEPGFTDPDELPSLIRPSAANHPNPNIVTRPVVNTSIPVQSALNPVINNASQSAMRAANLQVRNTQIQQHGSASAPATPAASMLIHRQARESSAGPPKRGPRSNSSLGNFPSTSSGLARHNSLGPGTPKGVAMTATGAQRAGSAGPRASSKASGSGANRKAGTPSSMSGGRNKKGTPAGGVGGANGINKSGLSRVKRAAKNSPSSTADSELSDAESGSENESDGAHGTPAAMSSHRSSSNQAPNSGGSAANGFTVAATSMDQGEEAARTTTAPAPQGAAAATIDLETITTTSWTSTMTMRVMIRSIALARTSASGTWLRAIMTIAPTSGFTGAALDSRVSPTGLGIVPIVAKA